MKRKLYGKGITPSCSYCLSGRPSYDKSHIFCEKKGIVEPDFKCRRFKYDPLRRVPKVSPELEIFSPKDFEL